MVLISCLCLSKGPAQPYRYDGSLSLVQELVREVVEREEVSTARLELRGTAGREGEFAAAL